MTIFQIEEEIDRIKTILAQHEPEMSSEEIRDLELDIENWRREIDSLVYHQPADHRSVYPAKITSLHNTARKS